MFLKTVFSIFIYNIDKFKEGSNEEKEKKIEYKIDNHKKTYKEYKQNGNSSWSEKEYWGGTMAENGCGITVMSIILSGYGKNYTPDDLRKKYYPSDNRWTTASHYMALLATDDNGKVYVSNPNRWRK